MCDADRQQRCGDARALAEVLGSVDREVAFYRRRSGEVFFFGVLSEVLVLVGHERLAPGLATVWSKAVHVVAFAGIFAVGLLLGREYRCRIRYLKERREALVVAMGSPIPYPPLTSRSEINIWFWVLGFLSAAGSVLVCVQ